MMAEVRRHPLHLLALLGVILLAFALRVHDLDGQSMWSDEGLSLYRARQPLALALNNIITVDGIDTQDTNPPLYFLLLNLWRSAAGESVFALRFLGAALATLSVPLIYGLATAVYRRRVGVITAVFLALSPLHVWQSQMLRNYGLLLSLNLLAVYALFRFLLNPAAARRGRWLFLWAGASALGVYTHYFGFFVLAFGLACLVIFTLQSNRALWRSRWLWLGLAATLLIILPIIPIALARFQAGQQVDFFHTPLGDFLYHTLNVFSAGIVRGVIHPWWRVLPVGLLALLGLFIGWRINRRGTWLVTAYQIIPLGLLLLLSLINPLYNGARHLLIGLPPFLLLCAAGMVGGWERGAAGRGLRWGGLALGLLAIGLQINWLGRQFTDPDLRIDDVRGAAIYLSAVATLSDRLILHDTLIGFTFDYYYEGEAPWQAMPLYGQQRVDRVTAQFAAAGEQTAGRVWFLNNPTPRTGFPIDRLPAQAAAEWTHLATRTFPSLWLGVELAAYLPNPTYESLPEGAEEITAVFPPHLQLTGHQLPTTATAGEPRWLSLYWSALPPETSDYTVSLRLLDESGAPWQQSDLRLWNRPPSGSYPSDAALLRTDYEFAFPSGLPPGDYTLWLRLLDGANQPIPTPDGQIDISLGQIATQSGRDATALPPHTPQTARRGDVTLLGYRLSDAALRPGHLAPLDLFWQVRQTPEKGLLVRAELLSPAGQAIAAADAPLARADHPPAKWQPGEIFQSRLNLLIPATAVPEAHTLRLTLVDENGRSLGRPITLNSPLMVAAWPLVTELPPLSQPIGALFGDPAEIRLAGVDLPETAVRPGETLPLTLVWQAIEAPSVNYAVFVHLASEAGEIVAQRDGMSVNGFRPSAGWRPDEVIVDPHDLVIPPGTPPGVYTLLVGLYEPENWQRPLLTLNNQTLPNSQLPLAQITIEASE
jgi:4-amino-4-deoxy-L-arabinose transferase-like glycosyltransferase